MNKSLLQLVSANNNNKRRGGCCQTHLDSRIAQARKNQIDNCSWPGKMTFPFLSLSFIRGDWNYSSEIAHSLVLGQNITVVFRSLHCPKSWPRPVSRFRIENYQRNFAIFSECGNVSEEMVRSKTNASVVNCQVSTFPPRPISCFSFLNSKPQIRVLNPKAARRHLLFNFPFLLFCVALTFPLSLVVGNCPFKCKTPNTEWDSGWANAGWHG